MAPAPASGARARSRGRSGAFLTSVDSDVWQPPAGFPPMADDDPDPAPPAPRSRRPSPAGVSGGLSPKQYAGKVGLGKPTLRFPSSPSWGDGSGFAMGLVLYAIGLCYIRGGLTGPGSVQAWFAAKFLNRTPSDPTGNGGADGRPSVDPDTGFPVVNGVVQLPDQSVPGAPARPSYVPPDAVWDGKHWVWVQ